MQQGIEDFFGRINVKMEDIENEQRITRERRWAEKVVASQQSGTPPENITIVTMWQVY